MKRTQRSKTAFSAENLWGLCHSMGGLLLASTLVIQACASPSQQDNPESEAPTPVPSGELPAPGPAGSGPQPPGSPTEGSPSTAPSVNAPSPSSNPAEGTPPEAGTVTPSTPPPVPDPFTPEEPTPTSPSASSTPDAPSVPGTPNPTPAPNTPSPGGTEPPVTTPSPNPEEPEPSSIPTLIGDVEFSEPSQSFRGTLTVELSSSATGEIHYTLDGSLPTPQSPRYESPLVLDSTTEVRAQVYVDGFSGLPSTALYVARDFDVTSDVPLLIVDGYMGGKPTDKETYRRAAFMLFEPQDGVASFSNLPTIATRAGHRLRRGQSSQMFAKTPYRVELWNNYDEDADYPIAGMPAEADWALISLYVDRSLVRNAFVYELGRELGLQAPRVAFAEVYVNHTAPVLTQSHYEGVYNITETIKNARNRLDLKQLKAGDTQPESLSGGYIFSFEYRAVEGESIVCTGSEPFGRGTTGGLSQPAVTTGFCWSDLELRDPDPPNAEQHDWITQHLHQFHDVLHTDPIGPYQDFIEVDTFVNYFLITELTRDMDAYIRSAFFHKDRDGKLNAGPLWDFDLSLGSGGFFGNQEHEGWQIANRRITHDWFMALTLDPAFLQMLSARWRELRQGPLSDTSLTERLAAISTPLANAAARDLERWPVSSVRSAASIFQFPEGAPWQDQLNAIREWMLQRASWIDSAIDQPITIPNYPLP